MLYQVRLPSSGTLDPGAVAASVQTESVGIGEDPREAQQINYSLASDEVRQVLQTLYHIYCEG